VNLIFADWINKVCLGWNFEHCHSSNSSCEP